MVSELEGDPQVRNSRYACVETDRVVGTLEGAADCSGRTESSILLQGRLKWSSLQKVLPRACDFLTSTFSWDQPFERDDSDLRILYFLYYSRSLLLKKTIETPSYAVPNPKTCTFPSPSPSPSPRFPSLFPSHDHTPAFFSSQASLSASPSSGWETSVTRERSAAGWQGLEW